MKEKHPMHSSPTGLEDWPGYTLNDLRYQRAINNVKMAVEQERLMTNIDRMVNPKSRPGNGTPGLMQKMFNGLSVVDYGLMAYSAFKQIRRVYKMFRR